jgi:ParB family chromosome partitioning protein
MTRKGGLGRGLDALIPGGEHPHGGGVRQVNVNDIRPNPRQPRSVFDPTELSELSQSIQEHGIIQPLIVSPGEDDSYFVLIAGERRLLAAKMAGLQEVPVIVREAGEQQRLELALIENVQRADLSPLESGEAYRQLAEEFDLSHEDIAARVGKSRVAVTNTLRLLKLPEAVRQALADKLISEGHARALLALPTSQAQAAALQTVLSHDLTVRQTEALVRRLNGEKPVRPLKAGPSPEAADMQQRLEAALGTKVSLQSRKGKGTITLHFYSDEEREALIERLLK